MNIIRHNIALLLQRRYSEAHLCMFWRGICMSIAYWQHVSIPEGWTSGHFWGGVSPFSRFQNKKRLFLICAYTSKFLGKTKRASPSEDGGAGGKSLSGKSLLPQKVSIHAGLRVIGKSGKRFFLTFSKNVLCIKFFWKSFWRFYFCLLPPSKNGHF